jgi:hypothetical protein
MASRYSVNLQPDEHRYCVWDNENYKIASNGRRYADLHVGDAFNMADRLNAENLHPKNG